MTIFFERMAHGKFDLRSCLDSDKREQEAFRVQSRFVAEVQNGFTKFLPNHLDCRPQLQSR